MIDGPVNECKHTSYTIIYPGTEETWYDQWNADLHLKKTMVSYYVDDDTTWGYDATCNDCGADLIYENGKIDDTIYSGRSGVDYKSIKSVFEAHSFVDGVCEHCGEKQTDESCQHTETKRVENTGKRTTELKSLNETEHEVTTTKYYELHCAACDAYISDDGTDTTTEKQPHDFSNGNTCACGYTKAEESCQHTKTKRVESVGSRKTELISLNDAEHEVKTTKTFKIRCAACDAYIRDDGTETTTVNKPHDLGNGNTCTCGYTKVETPEDAPYVLGFTMSVTEIEVDGTVTFTLSIATAKDGDKLAIEMRADDKFTVDKKVTVKDGKASCAHKFRNTGDRSIKFRVAGGEYCAAQTLKVLPKKTGTSAITGVRVSPPINEARVEKKDGETFTVTVVCNLDTVCVEMYFGKEHNQNTYRDSSDYVEANGNRIFKMTYTLGGDGKSYAGEYPISVRPFSYVDRADWKNNQMGEEVKITLKVTHDNVSTVNEGGYSYSWSANGHTRMQTITTTLECKVCGNVSKSSTKIAKGSEEPHDLGEDERCSVCEYGRWTDEDYKKEDERLRKLGNDVYTKIRSGDNDIRVPFPNGFGGYGGTYKCGTFVGLQARKLGFDYLNCYGKRFSGQPDGRDWCNYSRDIKHDWSGSRNGLGENLEIENTVDGKHYKQRIYLEKDAKEDCCLYDLLTANGNKNVYNVIISYSQKYNPNKKKQTSSDGHVRYIYAILKNPSNGKWMVYFTDNMTVDGITEGNMISIELDKFINFSRRNYYINGIVHFEPVKG